VAAIRWIPCIPAIIYHPCHRPNTTGTTDHGLKSLKLWAQINLSSLNLMYFRHFVPVMESWQHTLFWTSRTYSVNVPNPNASETSVPPPMFTNQIQYLYPIDRLL
jgi:hypothetical protein